LFQWKGDKVLLALSARGICGRTSERADMSIKLLFTYVNQDTYLSLTMQQEISGVYCCLGIVDIDADVWKGENATFEAEDGKIEVMGLVAIENLPFCLLAHSHHFLAGIHGHFDVVGI